MSIGGSASNNGVKFISDNYVASFVMDKNNDYKISYNKRAPVEGIRKQLSRIPLVKGISAMIEINPVIFILALFLLFWDFSPMKLDPAINNYLLIAEGVIFLGCLIFAFKKVLYKIRDTWRFHGAEHKTIYTVESDIELTLENVRKSPRTAKRCGTNIVVFVIIFFIILSFIIEYQGVNFIVAFVLGYEIFDLEKGDKYPVIKWIYKFGYWCQQKFFTREPTDIQILASIDTMNKLIGLESDLA